VTGDGSCTSGVCNKAAGGAGVCAAANACGNGKLEAGEGCDDGNGLDGDGCSATCKIDLGRPCNGTNPGVLGDGSCASAVCNLASGAPGVCRAADTCGNGKLEAGEGCDDGNGIPGDGCNSQCKVENGRSCTAKAGSSCESGVCNVTGGGDGLCVPAGTCGNSVLEAGEGCDDGNTKDSDGCSATCKRDDGAGCNSAAPGLTGDGSCTSGICNEAGGNVCASRNACGNSVLEAGEGCDDGNTKESDGCSATCKRDVGVACSDDAAGATYDGSCASGVCNTKAGKPGVCAAKNGCGNGIVEAGEGCDDGNAKSGDGCTATCKIEDGGACTTSGLCASGLCGAGVCVAAAKCGNGVVEPGEACDRGTANGKGACSATCLLEAGEACTVSTICVSGLCGVDTHVCEPGNDGTLEGGSCSFGGTSGSPVGDLAPLGIGLALALSAVVRRRRSA
jgi:cysteine-rich repeat protein